MTFRRLLLALACVATCAVAATAAASGPTFWTVANATDFLKGTSDGVFVSLTGVLSAGPQLTTRTTTTPAQIWSLVGAPDGTFWAGTGGDGRVLRLRPGQPEETVFDTDENNVFALAVSGTRVYVATGPDGKVYVIDGTAAPRVFFDPEEKYIWALAVDAAGRLWVGAGNPAVVYRVDASGASRVIYKPPAAHVVTLARDGAGRMLAGTESPGRVYRFDADDKPFALLDSGLAEIVSMSVDSGGAIFAAGVAKGDDVAAGEPTSMAATLSVPAPAAGGANASSSSGTTSAPARRSVVFRIDPNGSWEELWATSDLIYDVAALVDGRVLVATGPDGRLYQLDRNRDPYLLTGVDAKQITRFALSRTGTLGAFATANPGRVIAVGAGDQSPATYTSSVRDTKNIATWGLIRWEATGAVQLYTRTGNTEKPDDSWSGWAGPFTRKEGDPITSPAGRFVQWRAVLTHPANSPAAQLTSVTVAYLPRNSRPSVTSITVYPPGVVFQRPYASDDSAIAGLDDAVADARRAPGDNGPTPPAPGRRMFQKSLQTITWKGDDDDNDRLSYSVRYRREGETEWHDLKSGITDSILVWDTTSAADGRYVLRVTASDSPSNAADRALTAERESDPIEVDNTPPTIASEVTRQSNGTHLIVRVHDARSPVQKLEYSIGGGNWQVVYPSDGLADSLDERYEIVLTNESDVSRIVLRATDALQNVTSQPAVTR